MSGTRGIQDKTITIVSAGDMSANITSTIVDLQGFTAYSVQAVYVGSSPTGTLKVKLSNDGVTFSDYTGNSTAISASGDVLYKVERFGERFVELTYTFTSGTGTLNATIALQG